jgi:catechol 2,3-dioxygenase-like lactoylglutathione lyase family enzyme
MRLGAETLVADAVDGFDLTQRRKIESWVAALLQSEHLSLLIGNGLSMAVGAEIGTFPPGMASHLDAGTETDRIQAHAAKVSAAGRTPNLEDEIRSGLALMQGYDVLGKDAERNVLAAAIDECLLGLIRGVLGFERALLEGRRCGTVGAAQASTLLQRFLLPFAARASGRDRLNLYTTNYDRTLEFAGDLLGLRLLDRFAGTLRPRFSASRLDIDFHYSPPGIRGEPRMLEGVVRFSKLHGSIDWRDDHHEIVKSGLPFGASENSDQFPREPSETTIIYPNPAKDVETLAHPYAELFRDFAAGICRPNSVLFTYGYGYGDSHINRVISDMLTIPSTHLVVISRNHLPALNSFMASSVYPQSQTTEIIGPDVASLRKFVDIVPSLASTPFLEAQTAYADRLARLRNAVANPGTAPHPAAGGSDLTDEPPF